MARVHAATRCLLFGQHYSLQSYLRGNWTFQRTIMDIESGKQLGFVRGATASFIADKSISELLLYKEEGILLHPGTKCGINFFRQYLYIKNRLWAIFDHPGDP